MTTENTLLNETATEFVITRTFDAPRELVWMAWTEDWRLEKWWGPAGYKLKVESLDLRPEGIFHYSMEGPDGQKMYGRFKFLEISAPERMVFIDAFSDEHAGIARAPFAHTWPMEMLNILTLEEENGKTKMTLRGSAYNATEEEQNIYNSSHAEMQEGFKGTFDQLEAFLKKGVEIYNRQKEIYKNTQIWAYLNFNGNCREAMTFYKECLGGELNLQPLGNSPMASQTPEEKKNHIMHSSLTKGNMVLMGTDMNAGHVQQGNTVSLMLNCTSDEEISTCFEKLSEGGQVISPLEDTFWGARFGYLIDKFGMGWMLNFDKTVNQT